MPVYKVDKIYKVKYSTIIRAESGEEAKRIAEGLEDIPVSDMWLYDTEIIGTCDDKTEADNDD
jgi:hypothetical protein